MLIHLPFQLPVIEPISLAADIAYSYKQALDLQPTLAVLGRDEYRLVALVSFITGTILVVSSMYALGVTGTYLGDYSGILMDKRVEGFPFNVTNNPMYYGSTMSFFGTALWFVIVSIVARRQRSKILNVTGTNLQLDSFSPY